MNAKTCTAPGCYKNRKGTGLLCSMHASRKQRWGHCGSPPLPLTPHHLSQPGEDWLQLDGEMDGYWASSHGRIYSVPRERTPGGLLPLKPDNYGYLRIFPGGKAGRRVHLIIARAFLGEPAPGEVVRHLDDNKTNNHLANLAYGTAQDNADDLWRNGRTLGKLSPTQVRDIRAAVSRGDASYRDLAAAYGVSAQTILRVVHRRVWRHVA